MFEDNIINNYNFVKENIFIQKHNDKASIKKEDFNYKYSNDNIYYKSEIAMWKSVILQAFIDLQSNSKKKIANTYRIKALMWFNLNNEDFIITCNYAGLDPKYVHSIAMKVKAKSSFLIN